MARGVAMDCQLVNSNFCATTLEVPIGVLIDCQWVNSRFREAIGWHSEASTCANGALQASLLMALDNLWLNNVSTAGNSVSASKVRRPSAWQCSSSTSRPEESSPTVR